MSVVDEIKDRLDIAEVVQSYVPLKKAGRTYKGLCPFHAEKTPSFVVFPDSGTWHCFGACGTGGDVFTFVMKQENLDFGEALQILAKRAGVELKPRDPAEATVDQRMSLLREINKSAAIYFHHQLLNSDEAGKARAYLQQRGLNRETLEAFQVGYALNQWDGLLRYLTGKRYAAADIAEVGLIVERENKPGYYDRFRGRVIFPIRDHRGETIGFGGRVLDDAVPKYLNSPQTPIFDKSSVLFGLDKAKQAIRTTEMAIIVEGYMDVLMAHQNGINNVVAQMGTALTEAQLKGLKRHTQRFILALDSDVAGDQATLRGLDVARQVMDREVVPVPTPRGLIRFEDRLAADIRIVSLPPGRDPDEVIRESPAGWAQLIAGAQPIMDYYFQALTADLDLTSGQGKAEAVRRLGPLVAEVGDRVQRTHYVQQLARMVRTDERTLWQQIKEATGSSQPPHRARHKPASEEPKTPALSLDAHCLSYVLYYPQLLPVADAMLLKSQEEALRGEDLSRPEDQAILQAWRNWLAEGGMPDVRAGFYDTLDDQLQNRIDSLIKAREQEPSAPDDLLQDKVMDAITRLRLENLHRQTEQVRFLLLDARSSMDDEGTSTYVALIRETGARLNRLYQAMADRSVTHRRKNDHGAGRIPLREE